MITGNPEQDFFDQNPELKYMTAFAKVQNELSKSEASKLMWSVYLLEDPDSKFYSMPYKDRLAEIQDLYNPDFNVDDPLTKELITIYPRITMSKEKFMYKEQVDAMDALTTHLKTLRTEMTEDDKSFNKFIKVMEKLGKMWDGLDTIKQKFVEAESETQMRGGAQESARERRRKK